MTYVGRMGLGDMVGDSSRRALVCPGVSLHSLGMHSSIQCSVPGDMQMVGVVTLGLSQAAVGTRLAVEHWQPSSFDA